MVPDREVEAYRRAGGIVAAWRCQLVDDSSVASIEVGGARVAVRDMLWEWGLDINGLDDDDDVEIVKAQAVLVVAGNLSRKKRLAGEDTVSKDLWEKEIDDAAKKLTVVAARDPSGRCDLVDQVVGVAQEIVDEEWNRILRMAAKLLAEERVAGEALAEFFGEV